MVARILVILDGASEPLGAGPTALEAASTPTLDELCAHGIRGRLATTPAGCVPGSETGIPVLLGGSPCGRGVLEAAAKDVAVPPGHHAWRLDLHAAGGRLRADRARSLLPRLRAALPRHRVEYLRGHRFLCVGATTPRGLERVLRGGGCATRGGVVATVWGDGPAPHAVLDHRTVVISSAGAAAGAARLLGARSIVPPGATGDIDTDLETKARVALSVLAGALDPARPGDRGEVAGAPRTADGVHTVVVHVGGADEAAHRRDAHGKRAFIEALDRRLLEALAHSDATLAVAIDHGTCPRTGRHDSAPTPALFSAPDLRGDGRLNERAVAGLAVFDSPWAARLELAA